MSIFKGESQDESVEDFHSFFMSALARRGVDDWRALEARVYPPQHPAKSPEAGQRNAKNWFTGRAIPSPRNLGLIGRRLGLDDDTLARLRRLREEERRPEAETPAAFGARNRILIGAALAVSATALIFFYVGAQYSSARSYCLENRTELSAYSGDEARFQSVLKHCEAAASDAFDADVHFLIGTARMVQLARSGKLLDDPAMRPLVDSAAEALRQASAAGHENATLRLVWLYENGVPTAPGGEAPETAEIYAMIDPVARSKVPLGLFCRAVYEIFHDMGNRPPRETISDLRLAAAQGSDLAQTLIQQLANRALDASRLHRCAPVDVTRRPRPIPDRYRSL